MSDPSANSSENGFVSFRAATAIGGARGEAEPAGELARVPPPLPPPPPGVAPRETARPVSPARVGAASPPVPPPGGTRAESWQALVAWCVEAGVADGGLLAEGAGTILEIRGAPPVADAERLARSLCASLAAAREGVGEGPVAAAFDLGATWITAFAVVAAAEGGRVAAFWGKAPLRGAIRAPLARWLGQGGTDA